MIGYLKGKIINSIDSSIILDVNGVGYRIEVGQKGFLENTETELYIHTHVREQEISLYGFKNIQELNIFELLLSVSGVGPKGAMLMVNDKGYDGILNAINLNNPLQLKSKGIGDKTTQKIILELKGKISKFQFDRKEEAQGGFDENKYMDIIDALSSLGYRKNEIDSAIKSYNWSENDSTQDIIKNVLKILQK